jgi:hypothetical protein
MVRRSVTGGEAQAWDARNRGQRPISGRGRADVCVARHDGNMAGRLDDLQGKALAEKVMRYAQDAVPVPPSSRQDGAHEPDTMVITRRVYPRKGKWHRFPPEIEAAHSGLSRKG